MHTRALGLLLLGLFTAALARASVRLEFIDPLLTDPDMHDLTDLPGAAGGGIDLDHLTALDPSVPPRGILLLFLPGSGGVPSDYQDFAKTAASEGFHFVSLIYPNWPTLEALQQGQTDPDLPEKIHRERIYGEEATPLVSVTPADGIHNRLVKILVYLDQLHPSEGWGQYLSTSGQPRWASILGAGHSQGGEHIGYLTREIPLGGAVYCSSPGDFLSFNPPVPAPWDSRPGLTPASHQYGFVHQREPAAQAWLTIQDLFGLNAFGPLTSIDGASPPYGGSHKLVTNASPAVALAYHSSTAVDRATPRTPNGAPIFAPVWRTMLIGAAPVPCPADLNGDGQLDPDDLGDFISCYFAQPSCPRADFNIDGEANPDDLGDFITRYFLAC